MIEVRFHGRGGQGAVTAAELLAQAAIAENKHAQGFPSFGPERRGAPVTAFLRVSEEPIYLREKIDKPDVVVVLDESLIGLVEVCEGLKFGGTVVVNITAQKRDKLKPLAERYQVVGVNASRIAMESLGVSITNTAILGSLIKAMDLAGINSLNETMKKRFGPLAEKNMKALKTAYQETFFFDAPTSVFFEEDPGDDMSCAYDDLLQKEALLNWQAVPLGCDIEKPGNSVAFLTGNWRTSGRPVMDREKCIRCGLCWILCPDNAYRCDTEGYFKWDERYCKGCGICVEECPKRAIALRGENDE